MSENKLNRRQVLIGATAGAVGIGAAALSPMNAFAAEGSSVLGTWDVEITDLTTPNGPTTFEGATTFTPGGGLVTTASDQPTTGLGTWTKSAGNAFRARFMQFGFDPHGTSKVIVSINGTRSEDDSITGTFTYKVYDLQGNVLFGDGKGTFAGKRFSAG